jgi:phage shock protein PspC (stress-responsive transcriptional regulator)
MDKTIKINLGGLLFNTDEEAYNILRRYLQDIDNRLRNTPGGAETIEDIELRIAEIFQSQGGSAGVISKDNVEAMIAIIGKPEDFDINSEQGEDNKNYYRSTTRKKMYRNPYDSIIGGVCSGMGIYLNMESVWIRILFVMFAFFGGIGIFVYVALWISLPSAVTESMRKEMYGDRYHSVGSTPQGDQLSLTGYSSSNTGTGAPGVGSAVNEVFRAIGKVCFIILRVFLILVGLSFVLTGFISLVTVIMVFFFKFPGYFSTHAYGLNLFYLPDFLNYVVNPAVAPWIVALTFIVILMPLLAMIYWGVKMIFWFRAKDGIFALAGFVIWVISIAALSIILFNEGISYSEIIKTGSEEVLNKAPDNLYIFSGRKVTDLKYDKEISFPEEEYNIYFTDDNKSLYISPTLRINNSDDNYLKINVRKRSAGRSRIDATDKADGLLYNYRIAGDTLYLDEYFAVPHDRKWSFDNIGINLYVPEGTAVHFDKNTENMFRPYHNYDEDWDWDYERDNGFRKSENGDHIWVMTEDGLRKRPEPSGTKK